MYQCINLVGKVSFRDNETGSLQHYSITITTELTFPGHV